jgi:hypothetical protein
MRLAVYTSHSFTPFMPKQNLNNHQSYPRIAEMQD